MRRFLNVILVLVLVSLSACAQTGNENYRSFDTPAQLSEYLRWSPDRLPLIGAHRGGPEGNFPENCIATFEQALNYAPCLLEIDVRKSADGVLVLMHDASLDRTTDGKGNVTDQTWAELQKLYLRNQDGRLTGYRIPQLRDVLRWAKGKAILQLDVKQGVTPEEIVNMLTEEKARSYVVVITYNLETAMYYHRLDPELVISASAQGIESTRKLLESGISPQKLLGFVGVYEPDPAVYEMLHKRGVRSILGVIGNLDRKAAARGLEVYIDLLRNGADILATDYVSLAAQAIKRYQKEQQGK